MKRVLAIVLFYSAFSHGADVCSDIQNSGQVYLCSENKKNEADKYLNEKYSELLSKINSVYVNDDVLKRELIINVKTSQRDWIKFRDSNCKLYAFQIDSNSSAYQTTINNCVARMSESRGKELAEFSNDM
ncbi:lysozyme inhibitor LprI family protein [Hafnia alvei]|uniref:lysozyme inhibitor LprI family protein n=1 Tax=Hafnia alvei TaxID=569 RepID=UPI001F2C0BF8|nr:lysozyme inhibitor LprI family protein [Hafnia alvei]MCE9873118.1 lysozyme inhibitor LprI family protein [Hafnia alvei]